MSDVITSTTSAIETRFKFGKNWMNFLKVLNEERIEEAKKSLQNYLGLQDLKNKTFLDIGSGSGLFSLAAHRLGATVTSFDYDPDSVTCTNILKERYADQNGPRWDIFQGSVLDANFMRKLGSFDIVYSWGVLHHTGHMMQAFEQVSGLVKQGGFLFISIYNDQGGASRRWTWVKKQYNKRGLFVRSLLILYTLFQQWTLTGISVLLKGGSVSKKWKDYGKNNRGMSAYYDLIDWVGGYPFEVAKPEVVFNFFKNKGFELNYLKTHAGGLGCNEFVFKKN